MPGSIYHTDIIRLFYLILTRRSIKLDCTNKIIVTTIQRVI